MISLAASFYLYDHLGNTRVVYYPEVQCPTFVTYTIENATDYYPYGKTLRQFSTEFPQEKFLSTQHERDVETGLDYRGARFYDGDIARFLSLDPLAANYPSLSDYSYVACNPLVFADPTGMSVESNVEYEPSNEKTTNWTENHYRLNEVFGDPYGFNDFMEPNSIESLSRLRSVKLTVSGSPNGRTYLAQTYPSRDGNLYEVPVYTLTASGVNSRGATVTKTFDILRFMPYLSRSSDNTGYRTISENVIMSGLADYRNAPAADYNEDYEIHNTYSPENGGFVIYGNFMIHDGPDNLQADYGWGAAGCMEVCGTRGFAELKEFIYLLSGSDQNQNDGLNSLVNSKRLIIILEQATRPPVVISN